MTIWRYLLRGSDELYLPKAWLSNTARLRSYTAYTMRQLQQGSIVKDVAAKRREAFWQAIAAKRQPRKDNVKKFERVSER